MAGRSPQSKTEPKRQSTTFLLWPSIFAAALIACLPALEGSLLWDDTSHVTRPDLQSLHGLWRIWFDLGATQQYYPLLHSAFWIEHHLWGDAVFGYHLTNVLLHAASACLVVLIVRRWSTAGAWIAGLLFALHPVCVEAVAWISEQKSTLSGVLYLAAALVYLEFDESRRWGRYALALALFVLAMLAKSVTATLPAALLVVFWWRRGRVDWKRDVAPLAPWLAIGVAGGLFTAWVERTYIGAHGADFGLSAVQRVLLAGRVIWFYFGKLVWPIDLAFFYPRWTVAPSEWWQWLFPLGVAAAAGSFLWLARRQRGPLAGFLFFAGTLFPVLGFFNVYPFRYSFVADHFQYLASLGVLVPAGMLLARVPGGQLVRIAAPAVLLAALGIVTYDQSGTYRDSETLYRATLEHNPESWLAHNNLGNTLLETPGRRDEAIAQFEAALKLKPDYSEAHLSLGNALVDTPGRLADAIAEYRTAVRNEPNSERAHNNLANALLRAGQPQEAIPELQTALRIEPNYAEAHNNLGNAYSVLPGRLPDAIAEYRTAIRNEPNFPEAHNNLGRALAQSGRLPDAIEEFEAAIRLRPDYWSAHNNLGNALAEIPNRLPDAIAEYQAALRSAPDAANVHYNLANALARVPGRLLEAIAQYRAALQLAPDAADVHFMLANALAQLPDRKGEAIAEYEAVMKLRPNAQAAQRLATLRGQK